MAVIAKAMRATRPNRKSSALPSSPLHPPGGRTVASAMIPPAHTPAARTCRASAKIGPAGCPCAAAWPAKASDTAAKIAAGATIRRPSKQSASAAPSAATRATRTQPAVSPNRNVTAPDSEWPATNAWAMTTPSPPTSATASASSIGGRAHAIRGGFAASRLTTKAPMT